MKTIIIKSTEEGNKKLYNAIEKLEKYADRQIPNAVICTRYCDETNLAIVTHEVKEATKINDFDLFLVGMTNGYLDTESIKLANKTRTLVTTDTDLDSAKNYIIIK